MRDLLVTDLPIGHVKKGGVAYHREHRNATHYHDRIIETDMYRRRPFPVIVGSTSGLIALTLPFLKWQGLQGVMFPVALMIASLVAFSSLLQPYFWRVLEWRLDRAVVEWRRWIALRSQSNLPADKRCIEGAFRMANYEGITVEFQKQLSAKRGKPVTVGELWLMLEKSRRATQIDN